jgi:hypothetical protein
MRHQARTVGLGSGDTFEHNGKVLNEALALGIVTEEQLDADRPGAVRTTRTNAKRTGRTDGRATGETDQPHGQGNSAGASRQATQAKTDNERAGIRGTRASAETEARQAQGRVGRQRGRRVRG